MDDPTSPAAPRRALDDTPRLRWIFLELQGRLPRKAFWLYGVLTLLGLNLLLTVLLRVAGAPPGGTDVAVNLLLLWPAIAVSVKRWHDRDKSGWWMLVNLIPLVGWIWALVENGFLPGSAGANRFGEDTRDRF